MTGDIQTSLHGGTFTNWQSAGFLVIVIPLILFTLASNSFVIHAILNFKALKNPSNQLILSLAMTDLLSAIFVMPIACYYSLAGVWHFGKTGCQIFSFLVCILCASSVLHLSAIAVDRYKAISRPLTYARNRSNKKSLLISCFVWTLSFLMTLPPFFISWGTPWPEVYLEDTPCAVPLDKTQLNSAFFAIAFVIILVTYIKLHRINQKRNQRRIQQAAEVLKLKEASSGQLGISKADEKNGIKVNKTESRDEEKEEKEQNLEITNETKSKEAGRLGIVFGTVDYEKTKFAYEKAHSDTNNVLTEENNVKQKELDSLKKDNDLEELKYQKTIIAHESKMQINKEIMRNDRGGCQPILKIIVKGSKRRQIVAKSMVEMSKRLTTTSLPAKRCYQCQACLPGTHKSDICQICSAPNDLFLAAERSRVEILVQKERRSMFIIAIILCTFAACWTPAFLVVVAGTLFPSLSTAPWVHITCWWLAFANSACNPIIYTIFNNDFKNAFYKVFC